MTEEHRPGTAGRALSGALSALRAVECAKKTLDEALDAIPPGDGVRNIIADMLLSYLRRKKYFDRVLGSLCEREPQPQLRALLVLALTQLCCQSGLPRESAVNVAVDTAKELSPKSSGFVNAVLRNALRRGFPPMTDEPEAVLPDALLARWRNNYGGSRVQLFSSVFLSRPAATFHASAGFEPGELAAAEVAGFGGFRFYRSDDPAALIHSEALRDGRIYIQDPAAAMAVSLIEPTSKPRRVLDICAAPGGKSLLLAELLGRDIELTAADRSERRQKLTRDNFSRRNLDFTVVVAEPKQLSGRFDLVLADVPCSNTGVFRRRPDALWRFSPGELGKVAALQAELLEAAARRVAPGGLLLYSSCSIEPEENNLQVAAFLARHADFRKLKERQLLPDMEHDGAFGALLRRLE